MSQEILGIGLGSFEPALRAATKDLRAIVEAAVEFDADRIEPSHILLALSRVPDGTAAALLHSQRIPVDSLAQALHRTVHGTSTTQLCELDASTASDATAAVFSALRERATGGQLVGEDEILGHTLLRLEPPVAALLARFARIDVQQWGERLLRGKEPQRSVFGPTSDGPLDLNLFSQATRRVLTTMAGEASALGLDRLSTVLLLHTMAVTPNGLLELGLQFLQHDVAGIRARLFALVGTGCGRPGTVLDLAQSRMEPALALLLERAAELAAARRASRIEERDLLAAILESPTSVAVSFFRDAAVDKVRLLRFATQLHREPQLEPAGVGPSPVSLEEALADLRGSVIGQEAVVEQLIPYLETIKLGLELGYRHEDRPAAALLFCGPSGTGKTMTARVLARILFGSDEEVLDFEMGQFNSRESINNFIGAPPGYKGFGEGKLTNGLRDNPRRVLLFDEVDKADERVFDALLRLLDEGRISDPAGPVRDARESVIILTSNLGSRELGPSGSDVRSDVQSERVATRRVLERFFRTEFLNRVDAVIVFQRFGERELEAIASAGLQREAAKARMELGLDLTWDSQVPAHIAKRATVWRPEEAARGVNRTVAELVPPVLRIVRHGRARAANVSRIHVGLREGQFDVREA